MEENLRLPKPPILLNNRCTNSRKTSVYMTVIVLILQLLKWKLREEVFFQYFALLPPFSAWYFCLPMSPGKTAICQHQKLLSGSFTSVAGEDKYLAYRKTRMLPCLCSDPPCLHCNSTFRLHPAAMTFVLLWLCLEDAHSTPCTSTLRL